MHFSGEIVKGDPKTLLSAKQNPDIVDIKLAKELGKGRIAGPFSVEPFVHFKISPIGLVPKKVQGQFRLIHHLSYPKHSPFSINAGISQDFKSVSYASISDAISYLRKLGCGSYMAKTDIENAFRIIPLAESQYPLTGFVWKGKFYYDRCLAMGAASSCKTFEEFSSALEWIARNKGRSSAVVHILDDFLFLAPTRDEVALALKHFQEICAMIGVPLSADKTYPPSTVMEFMGITLDSDRMEARLPGDKIIKMRNMLLEFSNKRACTLKELLSLLGLLNFACSVIKPGRAFLRRLINLCIGVTELHHFVKIDQEAKLDIAVWLEFLTSFNGKSFFLYEEKVSSDSLQLYTDAAASLGYGACYKTKWFFGRFPIEWRELNITFLELYPIVIALELWGHLWKNHSVVFYTDNEALTSVINKQTTRVTSIMFLVRKLVLRCLTLNIEFKAKHIPGKLNCKADALSRLQVHRFKQHSPCSDAFPTCIPERLLPLNYCKGLVLC